MQHSKYSVALKVDVQFMEINVTFLLIIIHSDPHNTAIQRLTLYVSATEVCVVILQHAVLAEHNLKVNSVQTRGVMARQRAN